MAASLIPDAPLNPGVMHTIATGSSGHLGLYRLETQVTSGNGGLKTSGLGSNASAKEAIKVGFDYFKANASRVSASIKAGCCGRNVRGSSPSTSVVPLSNQVTTLNHKRFKGFKMFSDGH